MIVFGLDSMDHISKFNCWDVGRHIFHWTFAGGKDSMKVYSNDARVDAVPK